MRILSVLSAASAAAVAMASPALADPITSYNLFTLNNVDVHSGDIEGRVAAKGNASFQSYSIGNQASSSGVNLVVGGNLTATNGSTNGKTIVGGTATYSGWSTAGLQPSGTAAPVDFMAAATYLTQRSTDLAAYATNGTVTTANSGTKFTLTGATTGLSVFNLSAAALSSSNDFTINLTPGTTALINVIGTAATFSGGLVINGGTASNVLWNFSNAATLSFSNISMLGSVLAPSATYLGGWGQMHGELIVNNFTDQNGSTELHNDGLYTGGLLTPAAAVPEPASWALLIIGFGVVGTTMRRRPSSISFS